MAARQMAENAKEDGLYRLMTAAARSVRLVHEDLLRESGYMLPQSQNTHRLLEDLLSSPPSGEFPAGKETAGADLPRGNLLRAVYRSRNGGCFDRPGESGRRQNQK